MKNFQLKGPFYLAVLLIYSVLSADIRSVYFYGGESSRLIGHSILSVETKSIFDCGRFCLSSETCSSFNFLPTYRRCELNDATATQFPDDLQIDIAGAWYFGLQNEVTGVSARRYSTKEPTTSEVTTKRPTTEHTSNEVTATRTTTEPIASEVTTTRTTTEPTTSEVTTTRTTTEPTTTEVTTTRTTTEPTTSEVTTTRTTTEPTTSEVTTTRTTTEPTTTEVITTQTTTEPTTSEVTTTRTTTEPTTSEVTTTRTTTEPTTALIQATTTQTTTEPTTIITKVATTSTPTPKDMVVPTTEGIPSVGYAIDTCLMYYYYGKGDGVYYIKTSSGDTFAAYCHQSGSGGWTVIQRRQDDTVSFSRNFQEYKDGFGDLTGNFWLGLDKIASLCPKSAPCQFKVTMYDMSNEERTIIYNGFSVDSASQYAMDTDTISSQTAGDSMPSEPSVPFSTSDMDLDTSSTNCASYFGGGWWYTDCGLASPNGHYYNDGDNDPKRDGIIWATWRGASYSLKSIDLAVRLV